MRSFRVPVTAVMAAFVFAGLTAAVPTFAAPLPAPIGCLHVQGGGGVYTATYGTPAKKKDPAPLLYATARYAFQLGQDTTDSTTTASCLGATYTLHVKNWDPNSRQDSSQSLDYQGYSTAPGTGTATQVDPSEVDVTWSGDGTTTGYSASVTTGPNDTLGCLDAWITIALVGQPTTTTSHLLVCDTGVGSDTPFLG